SLKGVLETPQPCRIRHFQGTKRKIPWSLEMLKTKASWVGVNTHLTNALVKEAWELKNLWPNFPQSQGEVSINSSSRIDRVFWKDSKLNKVDKTTLKNHSLHFVEIKNVSMKVGEAACFPDAITLRGQKHLEELMGLLSQGHTCEMVYVVQREDCREFTPADNIDKEYGQKLRKAFQQGLKISVYPCRLRASSIELLTKPLSVKL
ncbi:MAG: DNA/RNA nuclease SfsA, partial [Bdellovibrionales bacterium]|nr:DNA/RNA nuclease SfsA [Bdellovibrionales bacterium]